MLRVYCLVWACLCLCVYGYGMIAEIKTTKRFTDFVGVLLTIPVLYYVWIT